MVIGPRSLLNTAYHIHASIKRNRYARHHIDNDVKRLVVCVSLCCIGYTAYLYRYVSLTATELILEVVLTESHIEVGDTVTLNSVRTINARMQVRIVTHRQVGFVTVGFQPRHNLLLGITDTLYLI